MPPILRALPYYAQPTSVSVQGKPVEVLAHQIVVWVGIARLGEVSPRPDTGRFPAILDTGHSGTFAIRPTHLRDWGGIHWPTLPPEFGYEPMYQGVKVPHRRANLWLYPNQYGWRDYIDSALPPFLLELNQGMAVYGDGEWLGTRDSDKIVGPRLPLVGLRALSLARLQLRIDAAVRQLWLDTL